MTIAIDFKRIRTFGFGIYFQPRYETTEVGCSSYLALMFLIFEMKIIFFGK